MTYPDNIQTFTNPTPSSRRTTPSLAAGQTLQNNVLLALQNKVGVDDSAVPTSLDYRVAQLEAGGGGGSGCVTIDIDDLIDLQTAGDLETCVTYVVTGWSTPNALPGPNYLFVQADAVDKLSPDVGVYCTTNAFDSTLNTYLGPVRGRYLWEGIAPGMCYLESTLGNKVSDLSGTQSLLDSIPWDSFFFRENVIDNTAFPGGYGVLGPLFSGNTSSFANNHVVFGSIDFGGLTAVQIEECQMSSPAFVLDGDAVNFRECNFGRGTKIDMTGKTAGGLVMYSCTTKQDGDTYSVAMMTLAGAGSLSLYEVEIFSSNISISSPATSVWYNSQILNNSLIQDSGTGARGIGMRDVQMSGSSIVQSRTGGPTSVDEFQYVDLGNASITLNGAVNPSGGQDFLGIRIFLGELNITNPAGTSNPINSIHIDNAILNVTAGAQASIIRMFGGGTLNTGAFTHQNVDFSSAATVTLTAANVNTYRGFGANTLV